MTTALPDWGVVSDAELARAAAAGDRAAFAAIYDRYASPLHDFCIGMLRNREAAADCVQDSFCIAAKSFSKLRDPAKLRPWLYAIARYEALRCMRGRKREQAVDEVPEESDQGPGPATLVRRNELVDLIAAAAGGLSDRDQAVYELAYRQGLEGAELAEALGVSPTNAKKMAQRLRETVERSLGALLVSWAVQKNVHRCDGLAEILDGWDGKFTVLMRKRVSRHIESCPTCDDRRRKLVNPVALLGSTSLAIPAPFALRQRTLDSIQLASSTGSGPAPQQADPEATVVQVATTDAAGGATDGQSNRFPRRVVTGAALLAGLIAVPAVAIAVQYNHDTSVAPANVTQTSTPRGAIGRQATPTTPVAAVPIVAPPPESGPAPGRVLVQDPTTYEAPATVTMPPPKSAPADTSTSVAPTVRTSEVFTPPQINTPIAPPQTVPIEPTAPTAPSEPSPPSPPGGGSTGTPPGPGGRGLIHPPVESLQPVTPTFGDGQIS